MPQPSNKISQFWQELKRRKVVRVITVYAAAAFVILELLSIIIEPLRLPEWTLQFAIVFLCIGFIIAVILSWIYDVHPEGGIVKTEPAHKTKAEDVPQSSNNWKIASYISFVVIVVLIVFNIVSRGDRSKVIEDLEKSIAVLPLEYLSEDPNKQYLANGVLDAITGHLSMIEGLRVMPRTSVEQYRDNKKSAKEIGEELDVSYLIEGSFLMIGNQVKLTIQLVVANEGDHLYYNEYDRDYKDIFVVQSEVAQTIAEEIEIAITPEEKQRIEKIPTSSLTAYDFYLRAVDEHSKHWLKWNDMEAVERAEDLYLLALEYDSTYAQAYIGLASVYWHKHFWDVLSENYLDSMLILLNIALSFDDQLAQAYQKRGDYYRVNNEKEQAIKEYDKALKISPNDWVVYLNSIYMYDDKAIIIEYLLKSASLHTGYYLSRLYRGIAIHLSAFSKEKSYYYLEEALKLDDDSADHFRALTKIEDGSGNFENAIEFGKKSYAFDSTDNSVVYLLGIALGYLGQYEESLEYFKKYEGLNTIEKIDPRNIDIRDKFRIGYAYWINGFNEKGEGYIDEGLKFYDKMLELNRISPLDFNTLYGFAAAHVFLGDRDKAYEYLRLLNQRQMVPFYIINDIKNDPMFDSIRDEPEFQQIVRDVEAKYQAEHERVRQWLEENEML